MFGFFLNRFTYNYEFVIYSVSSCYLYLLFSYYSLFFKLIDKCILLALRFEVLLKILQNIIFERKFQKFLCLFKLGTRTNYLIYKFHIQYIAEHWGLTLF